MRARLTGAAHLLVCTVGQTARLPGGTAAPAGQWTDSSPRSTKRGSNVFHDCPLRASTLYFFHGAGATTSSRVYYELMGKNCTMTAVYTFKKSVAGIP